MRGLMPRVFSYLTSQIASATAAASAGKVQYTCTASFLEIYMERVFDLLEGTSPACNLREDTKRGVYVEGLREEPVSTAAELERIMERGIIARRVGETAMNRESSRSHCVFTLNIASKTTAPNGAITERRSKFNLIDCQCDTQHTTSTCACREELPRNCCSPVVSVDLFVALSGVSAQWPAVSAPRLPARRALAWMRPRTSTSLFRPWVTPFES